jgi:hypothetical protein
MNFLGAFAIVSLQEALVQVNLLAPFVQVSLLDALLVR